MKTNSEVKFKKNLTSVLYVAGYSFSRSNRFNLGRENPFVHLLEGFVGLRSYLATTEKRKFAGLCRKANCSSSVLRLVSYSIYRHCLSQKIEVIFWNYQITANNKWFISKYAISFDVGSLPPKLLFLWLSTFCGVTYPNENPKKQGRITGWVNIKALKVSGKHFILGSDLLDVCITHGVRFREKILLLLDCLWNITVKILRYFFNTKHTIVSTCM
jgi:hypothetical protein